MTGRTIAIMQPTYLPWIGYFDLMDQCDLFVLLDTVQFDRRSWQQRNRIKTAQGELWLTVPVRSKGLRTQKIHEVEIDAQGDFATKHIRSVERAYAKAAHYRSHLAQLTRILGQGHRYLAQLTIELIGWLRQELGIRTELVRSSELGVDGKRIDLLVTICETVGAQRYLSPPGSRVYLDGTTQFQERMIELVYHRYRHPHYRQLSGDFIPYLSILDLLLNEGGNSLSVIRSGRSEPAVEPLAAEEPREVESSSSGYHPAS